MSRFQKWRDMRHKTKVNIAIGLILVIGGLALVGYPAWLWVEGKIEQYHLEQAFNNPSIEFPDEEYVRPQVPGNGDNDDYVVDIPEWTDFPPTKVVIPKLDVDVNVVAVDDLDIFARRLNHPPGYYPTSAYPGQVGNVTIAGHRDGPAGYFLRVNNLEAGDLVILETPGYSFRYEVERVWIVEPTDWSVVAETDYAALTLTTCQRVGTDSSAKRLIVRAKLKDVVLNDTE
ncbi:MAG: class E sortase [Firmicutes bacterium]|nr:class E sortase [Bacillota bacterium]